MLSRPTTQQILLDCRDQLMGTILPAVDDQSVRIAIEMMENVLRNCAARAGHEIAWMREEEQAMVAYAQAVAAAVNDRTAIRAALDRYARERSDSLHLDDVAATYDLAGHCLSAALEAAMTAGDDELHRDGRALLDARVAHENEIMGEWAFVGRA